MFSVSTNDIVDKRMGMAHASFFPLGGSVSLYDNLVTYAFGHYVTNTD